MLRNVLLTLLIVRIALSLLLPSNSSDLAIPQNLTSQNALSNNDNNTNSLLGIWPAPPYRYILGWGLDISITSIQAKPSMPHTTVGVLEAIVACRNRFYETKLPESSLHHFRDREGPVVFEYRTVLKNPPARIVPRILDSLWDRTIRWEAATISAQILVGDSAVGWFYLLVTIGQDSGGQVQ